jgi:hypothetical protein
VDVGGEAGGVSSWRGVGCGPGEQYGMCLFGTAVWAFRCEVLMLRWPGGGVLRPGSGAGRARMVAIRCGDEWRREWGLGDADADGRKINRSRDGVVESMHVGWSKAEGDAQGGEGSRLVTSWLR